MLEVRRNLELPTVTDADPQACVSGMLPLLEHMVDGNLPGLAIQYGSDQYTAADSHGHHRNLVADAFAELNGSVRVVLLNPARRMRAETDRGFHIDSRRYTRPQGALIQRVRIHTADDPNGAQVVLANAAPGAYMRIADIDLYSNEDWLALPDAVYEHGYENRTWQPEEEIYRAMYEPQTGHIPTHCESNFYYYTQNPGDSVIFRTVSSFVRATLHGFVSLDPSQERTFQLSDFVLSAQ